MTNSNNKSDQDRQWWNTLDHIWKDELISLLLDSPGYLGTGMLPAAVLKLAEESDEVLADIVKLEKVHISRKVLFDLTPLSHLNKISDFHIQDPDYKDRANSLLVELYPKFLRSKVRKLNLDNISMDDFTTLEDFVNLEVLQCQGCGLESIEGIQKLTMLKELRVDQGNFFSDLGPLRGLGLVSLSIDFSQVTDISPLLAVPSLECIDLSGVHIFDLSPLLHLPNLKNVILPNFMEVSADELEQYLKQDYAEELKQERNRFLARHKMEQTEKPDFNYNKTWYLLLDESSCRFPATLSEGMEIMVYTAKIHPKKGASPTGIVIADFIGLCENLSGPLVYPVTIETLAWIRKKDDHSWYVDMVKLNKPKEIRELVSKFCNIHPGNIRLSDQATLPENCILPTVIKGDLEFNSCVLPLKIRLPQRIGGKLIFDSCSIPATWQLPGKIKHIVLENCTFDESFSLLNLSVEEVTVIGCREIPKLLFPPEFPGKISIEHVILDTDFHLPVSVGELFISSSVFRKGFIFPERISKGLDLFEVNGLEGVVWPLSCRSFSAMECKFPDDFNLSLSLMD